LFISKPSRHGIASSVYSFSGVLVFEYCSCLF
jgi:hypothetical protein